VGIRGKSGLKNWAKKRTWKLIPLGENKITSKEHVKAEVKRRGKGKGLLDQKKKKEKKG